jgi:hypothetical protein
VLHVVTVPEEGSAVDFTNGRATTNPDDPDGDDHEQSAWWDPEHARKNPALRQELKGGPWDKIKKAAEKWTITDQGGGGHGELPERPHYQRPNGVENCRNCGIPENAGAGEINPSTGYCARCDNLTNAVGDPKRREPSGGSTHAWWTEQQPMSGQHEQFSLQGWDPAGRSVMHTLSGLDNESVTFTDLVRGGSDPATYKSSQGHTTTAAWLTVDDAYAAAREAGIYTQEQAREALRQQMIDQELALIFSGTLHDEPEGALPSTDGAEDDTDADDAEPGDPTIATSEDAMPGLPLQRIAPWGYPESAADHPNPDIAQPAGPLGSDEPEPIDDQPNGLFHTEAGMITAPEYVPEDFAMAAQFEPVLADFARSAGFRALAVDAKAPADQGGGVEAGDAPNDSDIARAAQELLRKQAAKDFSFEEQQELIREGGGTARARNFNDLKVEGTHYAQLGEDEAPLDAFLLL